MCGIGYCVLYRVDAPGVLQDNLIDRDTVVLLAMFSLIVGAGYLAGLVALGAVTRIDCVNDARLVFPLNFVLLAQLLVLSVALLDSSASAMLKRGAVVVALACSATVLLDQMSLAAKQCEMARSVRDAFRRAPRSRGTSSLACRSRCPIRFPATKGFPCCRRRRLRIGTEAASG